MDKDYYVYAELNDIVEKEQYKGITSDTAEVIVDNNNSTIKVDILKDSGTFKTAVEEELRNLKYYDSVEPFKVVKSVTQDNGKINVIKSVLNESDIPGLTTHINTKQDILGFAASDKFPYDKEDNPVVTTEYLENKIGEDGPIMHYLGVHHSLDDVVPKFGDVCSIIIPGVSPEEDNLKEYIFTYEDGTPCWREIGDQTKWIKHGEVDDSEIKENANIAQSKISGLVDDLSSINSDITNIENRLDTMSKKIPVLEFDLEQHNLDISYEG